MGSSSVKGFVLVFLVCFTAVFGAISLSRAQTATTVIGTINSNTTWTKANSPYALIGPLTVNNGATLTIEAGVTVYITSYTDR